MALRAGAMETLEARSEASDASEVDEVEEELIRRLFLPRSASITSESELLERRGAVSADNEATLPELHLRQSDAAEDVPPSVAATTEATTTSSKGTQGSFRRASSRHPGVADDGAPGALEPAAEPAASVATAASSLKHTERQLKKAERNFLDANHVRAANVSLRELSERFGETAVPTNPLGGDEDRIDQYLEKLVDTAVKDAVNTSSPAMIGHMTSSLPFFMRPLSRLVTTMNQNVVKTETANTVTFLEREALAQLHRQIYHRDEEFYAKYSQAMDAVLGVFTSGGTVANTTALWIARNSALGPRDGFAGIEQCGLMGALRHFGYEGACVVGSELLHYSMGKAVDVLGLGMQALVSVPFDENFKVRLDLVEEAVRDCEAKKLLVIAILGVAGATETGTIDDLDGLATIAERHKIHFHVDAAWGGPLVFSRRHVGLLRGIERAHSVTLDGHKQLYMPMGCGLCFLRDPALITSVQKTARYIIRKESYDLGKFTLEGSRPANAVYLHANLNVFGVRGYEVLVDRSIRIVRFMARQIEASKGWFELVTKPLTNILLYRAIPPALQAAVLAGEALTAEQDAAIDELNVALQQRQTLQGRTFVSRTTIRAPNRDRRPVVALRVVIANPLTFESDILRVLRNQLELLADLLPVEEAASRPMPKYVSPEGPRQHTRAELLSPEDTCEGGDIPEPPPSPFAPRRTAAQGDVDKTNTLPLRDASAELSKSRYWSEYWETMPLEVRNLFKGNKELFLTSLVAPELGLEDDQGLFSKGSATKSM
ncbi:Glutamate decarboxylase 2 [Hondaea fermentalgiana]|uniref:Glutamate decarboxylase 2 n=1 Tax=Hondaea fermentalgiana TaxID=2315210 RepID=A0A2R5GEZ9_9STRA|nr:Glutamate decarboxylase 2 [Hondaea fermentalgiana]|eukprot:GBG29512.1 Glutamate decarboxylase 2 [Hondaea fermentalgiana]